MNVMKISQCVVLGFVVVLCLVIGCSGGGGSSGGFLSFLAPVTESPPLAQQTVLAREAAELAAGKSGPMIDGLTFAIPAGTLPTTETIAISTAADPVATETISLVFSPEGLVFDTTNATPTLTVTYTNQFLVDNGIEDPVNIRVASRNAASGIVEELTVLARDTVAKTITVAVPHFSIFEMFGTATQPTGFVQVLPVIEGPLKFYPTLPESTKNERTLLLVHGICSSGQDLVACANGLLSVVKKSAVLTAQYKRVFVYNYPWKRGFNATDREKRIENRPAMFLQRALAMMSGEVPMVDILAHSMGGCVSRYALEQVDTDDKAPKAVRNLVMIATPSGGVALGSLVATICAASLKFQAAVDLSPLSVRIGELASTRFDPLSPRYVTIAGNVASTGHDVFIPPAFLGVATTSVELGEQGSSESRPNNYEHITFHGKPGAFLAESPAGHSGLHCRATDQSTLGEFANITSSVSRTINPDNTTATVLKTLLRDPTIQAVSPSSGPLAGDTPITITGASFFTVSQVMIGGVPATNVTISAAGDRITCLTPATAIAGAKDITVTSLTHGSATKPLGFNYISPSDGSFSAATSYAVGTNPIALSVGDFNGDGKPDIAVANQGSNDVSVLLGSATGRFALAGTFAVAGSPGSLAIADFNHDGRPDLAVPRAEGVLLLLGTTVAPFFTPGADLTCACMPTTPKTFTVADFNGDGRPDIVVGNGGPTPGFLWLSAPNDTYTSSDFYAQHDLLQAVVAADLNRDGNVDLLIANRHGPFGISAITVLLGNGTGTFGPVPDFPVSTVPPPSTDFILPQRPKSIGLADVNGDGILDAVISSLTVFVLLGTGTGGFGPVTTFPVSESGGVIAVGDVNGDGISDFGITNNTSNTVSVLLGNGAGGVSIPRDFPVGVSPGQLAITDLNGDGKRDIAVVNFDSNDISVLLQQ